MTREANTWLDDALAALGALLQARGLHAELVVVGGASLLLHGVISRPTRDVDVLGGRSVAGGVLPMATLPPPLASAVADVGLALDLRQDWLNLGPAGLLKLGLPKGFAGRLAPRTYGGLVVWLAAPEDLVYLKVYAAADHWPLRDRHMADLVALRPSARDLQAAAAWAQTHDPSPAFADNLTAMLAALSRELGHGE